MTWAKRAFGPRWPPDPRRALAELPGEVFRVQPDAQENAGALAPAPRGRRPARGPARNRTGPVQRCVWHGVFGGLYLPTCEKRSGAISPWLNGAAEGPGVGGRGMGHRRRWPRGIWVHSDRFSAIVSPWRGAEPSRYTLFSTATNYANTLTRRREAYHDTALEQRAETESHEGDAQHSRYRRGIRLDQRPPIDVDDRALFVDRVISSALQREQYASGDYRPVKSWARCRYTVTLNKNPMQSKSE